MQITVRIPGHLAQYSDHALAAPETFAIEGHRPGAFSAYRTRQLLGFETRSELDCFLKQQEVRDHAYSVEDLKKDRAGFERRG
jgi:hypothetical protein